MKLRYWVSISCVKAAAAVAGPKTVASSANVSVLQAKASLP
jgi:hypothetical protein